MGNSRSCTIESMHTSESLAPASVNDAVKRWVQDCVDLCAPQSVRWCNGSDAEYQELIKQAVNEGALIALNPKTRPGGYLHRSHPNDTARTEHLTFICTPTKAEAGPNNNWMEPQSAYDKLTELFRGSMKGRPLYVVPFLMGPPGSPLAKVGFELTDSIYVVINMRIMTRMGAVALSALNGGADFTKCLHSIGDLNPDRRFICHFPQHNTIWSFGSGYGGNALLGKKCLALRVGSYLGRQEGWLAEHMFISGITDPQGNTSYLTGAFPSACGKTNLAMLTPPERFRKQGWKVTTLGDDIGWMHVAKDGVLYAVNPENGYFGVVPGTSYQTNPNAMESLARNSIFTNVALLSDGDVWWEGKDGAAPKSAIDWQGKPWTPESGRKAAHPNSRFTAPAMNNPILSPKVNDPTGVPVSAMIFGGRRSQTIPLIVEAFNWQHGVYLAALLSSETTAAATGQVGVIRRDPMAMLPFCGYNMGWYFAHWLDMQKKMGQTPRIFYVNWFRKDEKGKSLWPGFGENMRIVKWMLDRCQDRVGAVKTPLGWMPNVKDIDLEGSGVTREQFEQAQAIDRKEWQKEVAAQAEFFASYGSDMPKELVYERELLLSRL